MEADSGYTHDQFQKSFFDQAADETNPEDSAIQDKKEEEAGEEEEEEEAEEEEAEEEEEEEEEEQSADGPGTGSRGGTPRPGYHMVEDRGADYDHDRLARFIQQFKSGRSGLSMLSWTSGVKEAVDRFRVAYEKKPPNFVWTDFPVLALPVARTRSKSVTKGTSASIAPPAVEPPAVESPAVASPAVASPADAVVVSTTSTRDSIEGAAETPDGDGDGDKTAAQPTGPGTAEALGRAAADLASLLKLLGLLVSIPGLQHMTISQWQKAKGAMQEFGRCLSSCSCGITLWLLGLCACVCAYVQSVHTRVYVSVRGHVVAQFFFRSTPSQWIFSVFDWLFPSADLFFWLLSRVAANRKLPAGRRVRNGPASSGCICHADGARQLAVHC